MLHFLKASYELPPLLFLPGIPGEVPVHPWTVCLLEPVQAQFLPDTSQCLASGGDGDATTVIVAVSDKPP